MYPHNPYPFPTPASFPFPWPVVASPSNPFLFQMPTLHQRKLATTIASPLPDGLQPDLRAALLTPEPLSARVLTEAEKRALARALAADLGAYGLPELQSYLATALTLARQWLAALPTDPARAQRMAHNGRLGEQISTFRRFWVAFATQPGGQGMAAFRQSLKNAGLS